MKVSEGAVPVVSAGAAVNGLALGYGQNYPGRGHGVGVTLGMYPDDSAFMPLATYQFESADDARRFADELLNIADAWEEGILAREHAQRLEERSRTDGAADDTAELLRGL